jgi:hypothetical protein
MTPLPTTSPTTRAPHLLPAPSWEPPYDDELDPAARSRRRSGGGHGVDGAARDHLPAHGAPPPVQGALALSFVLPGGLPAVPELPVAHLRVLPAADPVAWRRTPGSATDRDLDDFGPQPTGRAHLPEPRAWGGRLVQALVEVLAGDRPAGQLVRWTSSEVYDDVTALVPAPGHPGPGRRPRPAGKPTRAAVRSVHVTEPADGVAEVAATVSRGRRTTAVALRLEGLDGRWQCTALELG